VILAITFNNKRKKMTSLTTKDLMIISYGFCEISSIFRGINRQIKNEEMIKIFEDVILDYVDLSELIGQTGKDSASQDNVNDVINFFRDRHTKQGQDEEK